MNSSALVVEDRRAPRDHDGPTAQELLAEGIDRFGYSWKDRHAAVVGLGRSGLAVASLLRRSGCHVHVTDAQETDSLRAARATLSALGVEEIELGGHSQRLIEQSDAVIVSPGIPESAGPIQWALARGLPILSEVELAFRFCPARLVAVTGTNGKSSAVTLIAQVLKAQGHAAIACGNLGVPFSSVIDQLTSQTIAVVEVSSFQLLWCHQFRPRIGVLLNIGTNHLDRHPNLQSYMAAKARLFQQQTPDDWAVLNGGDPRIVELSGELHARCVWFGENLTNPAAFTLAPQTRRSLPASAQAVLQVGRILGIPDPLTWQVIRSSRGLEHRLEFVGTIRGVRLVNDSKSTTPESCLFALAQTRGDVVVILGGRDKGLEFGPLMTALHEERVKGIVLIGESRARLRAQVNGHASVRESATLDEAVRTALTLAGPGATVLFSPACASFDMFRDFEDRGRAFKTIVQRLSGETGGQRPETGGQRPEARGQRPETGPTSPSCCLEAR